MRRAVSVARTFHVLAGLAMVAAYTAFAIQPPQIPDRAHRVDRVAGLVAYCGLAGAGPGTVGRL